jgi:hypothetical protein
MPAAFADNLLALREWQGHNVFLARQHIGPYRLQVTEGGGRVIVELAKNDGTPLLQPEDDLIRYVQAVAKDVLSDGMQPREFHRVSGRHPVVAVWKTAMGTQADAHGVALPICVVSAASPVLVRYEVCEEVTGTARAGASPPPYTFGEPMPQGAPTEKTPTN